MPEQATIERAREDEREGKAPSTQAGEFVREEFHHIRQGKHGARSSRQAIAIGLSKARRAGVKLRASRGSSKKVRSQAKRDLGKGRSGRKTVSRRRARATLGALKREGRGAASTRAISRQVKRAARRRSASSRSTTARMAARTRSRVRRGTTQAGRKAAHALRKTTRTMRRVRRSTTMTVRHAGRSLLSPATRRMARRWLTG